MMTASEQLLWGVNVIVGLTVIASFFRAGRAERRAEEAHRLATEAHDWRREEAERTRREKAEDEARRAWCARMKAAVDASRGEEPVADDVSPEWVKWGEDNLYFRAGTRGRKIVVISRL